MRLAPLLVGRRGSAGCRRLAATITSARAVPDREIGRLLCADIRCARSRIWPGRLPPRGRSMSCADLCAHEQALVRTPACDSHPPWKRQACQLHCTAGMRILPLALATSLAALAAVSLSPRVPALPLGTQAKPNPSGGAKPKEAQAELAHSHPTTWELRLRASCGRRTRTVLGVVVAYTGIGAWRVDDCRRSSNIRTRRRQHSQCRSPPRSYAWMG